MINGPFFDILCGQNNFMKLLGAIFFFIKIARPQITRFLTRPISDAYPDYRYGLTVRKSVFCPSFREWLYSDLIPRLLEISEFWIFLWFVCRLHFGCWTSLSQKKFQNSEISNNLGIRSESSQRVLYFIIYPVFSI